MTANDPVRGQLAEDRTDLAEDRTLLANERTFSGWARTAMASIGIGIGFHALFRPIEPTWVAKAIATYLPRERSRATRMCPAMPAIGT